MTSGTKSAVEVSLEDFIYVAGDLNGYVKKKTEGYCCHTKQGFGTRNIDGECILDYIDTH